MVQVKRTVMQSCAQAFVRNAATQTIAARTAELVFSAVRKVISQGPHLNHDGDKHS